MPRDGVRDTVEVRGEVRNMDGFREIGRTVRAAIECKRRTGRLCVLLLVGAVAGAVFLVVLIGVRMTIEQVTAVLSSGILL
jgi:hypothetical protein